MEWKEVDENNCILMAYCGMVKVGNVKRTVEEGYEEYIFHTIYDEEGTEIEGVNNMEKAKERGIEILEDTLKDEISFCKDLLRKIHHERIKEKFF